METLNTATCVHRDGGIEWSAAARPIPGETLSGDGYVLASGPTGVLAAVIDGLGHGDEANAATRCAADVLRAHPELPPIPLLQRCHAALRNTRGAAMTIMAISPRERTAVAVGVGNVETVIVHADGRTGAKRESVLLGRGVVGYRMPPLQPNVIRIAPGDLIVFATDGVRDDFGDSVSASGPLPSLAERLLAKFFRGTDDALVLAGRILADDEN